MHHSFDQQEFETQKPDSLVASQQVFENILRWVAGLTDLTEEEQKDSGLYIGNQKE